MSLLPELARRAAARPAVVLDDDPTGTQTVRDLAVLTAWDALRIARHLDDPAVFLSTNSRALGAADAVAVTRDAVRSAMAAAERAGRPISVVSRNDSTLRGHFPAETRAIADAMNLPGARIVLAPFFGAGGRVTVGDVHYLQRDGVRTPVADTEFASDPTFGYRASNLRDWVAEKYADAGLDAPAVHGVSLDVVRAGAGAVADALAGLAPEGVAIMNAETEPDIETIALGVLLAEEAGLPIVARTGASYVRARGGQPMAGPLAPHELAVAGPGLIVVGSHVPTTTAQLQALAAGIPEMVVRELTIGDILSGDASTIARAAAAIDAELAAGRTVAVTTERRRHDIGLEGGRRVSDALVGVVRAVSHRPSWVLAKGGITSFDVARRGLEMSEARIVGQLLPGVPVWRGAPGSRWPGLPLVVFPGNVGGPGALLDAYRRLTGIE